MADTIFALATAPGRAGLAVIRVSGPEARTACEQLAGSLPSERRAGLRRLMWDGELLDEALVLPFAPGASFTGEAVVELHLHGSVAVVSAVLDALGSQPGLRLAEPGEFTRRALEGGRIDLSQVEGLADLIGAETAAQRRQALRLFGGDLAGLAESWRARMLRAVALLEAGIDFADEDVPEDVVPEVVALVGGLQTELEREVAGSAAAERIQEGFEIALIGPPNAGKSTLLNRLAGREAAITSEIAGTTRDVVEVRMDIAGFAVTFLDMAGLRETDDPVESIGVSRARSRGAAADLRLFLGAPDPHIPVGPEDILLCPKSDLGCTGDGLPVSGVTGEGIPDLIARIAVWAQGKARGATVASHVRHRVALKAALGALAEARDGLESGLGDELVAESLRQALRAVESIVGRIGVEDVLGEIFSSFCIGK